MHGCLQSRLLILIIEQRIQIKKDKISDAVRSLVLPFDDAGSKIPWSPRIVEVVDRDGDFLGLRVVFQIAIDSMCSYKSWMKFFFDGTKKSVSVTPVFLMSNTLVLYPSTDLSEST